MAGLPKAEIETSARAYALFREWVQPGPAEVALFFEDSVHSILLVDTGAGTGVLVAVHPKTESLRFFILVGDEPALMTPKFSPSPAMKRDAFYLRRSAALAGLDRLVRNCSSSGWEASVYAGKKSEEPGLISMDEFLDIDRVEVLLGARGAGGEEFQMRLIINARLYPQCNAFLTYSEERDGHAYRWAGSSKWVAFRKADTGNRVEWP